MSESKAATTVNKLAACSMEGTVTSDAGASPFEPSLWADFFVTYTAPSSERSEEWMRERANQLKNDVSRMFEAGNATSVNNTLMLVDALERLGIDHHFQEEINTVLCLVHREELMFGSLKELHIDALRFRLLRQHGFFVSTGVFDKYRDGTGTFSLDLIADPRGLLSLYNAAHMAIPGKDVLDDAISFTRSHLESMKGNLGSPLSEQVARTLDIPLPRYMLPLESMHYITEYEKEEVHNAMVLELARLEYNITRSLHLKELRDFCLSAQYNQWAGSKRFLQLAVLRPGLRFVNMIHRRWNGLYKDVKLTYSRDRGVEMYFWSYGLFQGEINSRARIMFSKIVALVSLMDDTYDTHATFEECKKITEALQRWDESTASILPEYLQAFYIKILSIFNEFENILEPGEQYHLSHVQKAYMFLSKYYLEEVKWCNENYIPSFKDQIELSSMSSSIPVLTLAALMVAGDEVTKEIVEWASGVPDMVHACGEIGRLLNDIAGFKKGRKNKNDVASSMECYMKEHGATGVEAATALAAVVENAWRRINKAFMEIDRAHMPAVKLAVVNLARANAIIDCGGNDAYTFTGDLEGLVSSLFLKPVPV